MIRMYIYDSLSMEPQIRYIYQQMLCMCITLAGYLSEYILYTSDTSVCVCVSVCESYFRRAVFDFVYN